MKKSILTSKTKNYMSALYVTLVALVILFVKHCVMAHPIDKFDLILLAFIYIGYCPVFVKKVIQNKECHKVAFYAIIASGIIALCGVGVSFSFSAGTWIILAACIVNAIVLLYFAIFCIWALTTKKQEISKDVSLLLYTMPIWAFPFIIIH